jgi:integrase
VPFKDIAAVMAALAADGSVAALALRFLILTEGRVSEVIEAPWTEIDFDAAVWSVPAKRMKGRRPHTVPLSSAAIALLKSLPTEDDNPFVFIGASLRSHVAEGAVTEALRRAGRRETLHGFRSTFRTWAAERTTFPRELAEKALAHLVGDETERAYQRGELLAKRAELMEAWAEFCAPRPADAGNVVPMRSVIS